MASVSQRKGGKGKWIMKWKDEHGKWKTKTAGMDKTVSLKRADFLESEAAKIRDGMVSVSDRGYRAALKISLPDHIAKYHADLLAKAVTKRYAYEVNRTVTNLLKDAGIQSIGEISPERVQAALARIKAVRSPSTANTALGAIKSFCRWLQFTGRIEKSPLFCLAPYSIKVGRKRIRRSLTVEEAIRLFETTEAGPTVVGGWPGRGKRNDATYFSGPDRAMLYRIACDTGLRAGELRTLTPESFQLDSTPPAIVVEAGKTKNDDEAIQPIRPELAEILRGWLKGRPQGRPVFVFRRESAEMLRADLERAGISVTTKEGEIDFHALRVSFVSMLIRGGANIKVVQALARHSTPALTLAVYAKANDDDKVSALHGLPAFGARPRAQTEAFDTGATRDVP